MLNAVFLTSSLPYGGAERQSISLMNRLVERGHRCHAVYLKDHGARRQAIPVRKGITVRCLKASRYFDSRALARLNTHLAQVNPSVLVAVNPYAMMYAALARARWRGRMPLVVTHHSTWQRGVKKRLQMLAYRPFFWSVDCTVFLCRNQRQYWKHRAVFSPRNEVIYNGIDIDAFCGTSDPGERARLRREIGFNDDDYVIGISALLRPEKNHVQLVDVVAKLRQSGIPARALMIGDGQKRDDVEARARALNVERSIVVTGFRQDVRPCLEACDVAALCSLTETFPLAALEAMAMRRPVVLSDVGGASEMVFPGQNGFLFPVGDTKAFADKLTMLSDRKLAARMGNRAREIVTALFSEQVMVDRYERLLMELCRTGHRASSASHDRQRVSSRKEL